MNYQMLGSDTFPIVQITLGAGESVQLERGAMIYHDGRVNLEGKMNSNGKTGLGGLLNAMGRSMASGEAVFMTTATGMAAGATLGIAPANPGKIIALTVDETNHWRLNTGAFLAADSTATYQMVRQKVGKALLGGTGGFFVMESVGTGTMLASAYGDLLSIALDGRHDYVIDNNHVVAWSSSLDYHIEVASGAFGRTTGEGFVNRFTGSGRIYIQTRNVRALAELVRPFIATKSD